MNDRMKQGPAGRLDRRRWLQGAALLAAGLALPALPRLGRAEPAAPVGFDTLEFDWADAQRQRPVPVRLYLPQTERRVPLVVFSHGIGGSRRGYSWLGTYLAAHGVASLHPQHVGSDRQVWFGNVFSIAGRLAEAAQEKEAIARALDLRFVLDTVLDAKVSGELASRFDTRRIVAAGHSYGANTALLAAGARVERDGRAVDLSDSRLSAAILISAPPFYGEGDPRRIVGGVTLPTLHVTATEDVIRIPGYWSGADDRVALFDAIGSTRKWLAMYEGGSHSIFTDRGTTGGPLLNPQVKAATRSLAVAFLRGVLEGDESALAAWPAHHAGILARFAEGRA
jgi:predicted dienelactone hydrolase